MEGKERKRARDEEGERSRGRSRGREGQREGGRQRDRKTHTRGREGRETETERHIPREKGETERQTDRQTKEAGGESKHACKVHVQERKRPGTGYCNLLWIPSLVPGR